MPAYRKNNDVPALLKGLKRAYPEPECELTHSNPLELLVATILSAQCTDKRVNMVTPALFKKYRSAKEFAEASPVELECFIKSTGFYRNKAKNILGMARAVASKYKGEVPRAMEDLLELPGVARKTANVVRGVAFGLADGVVVDTHVMRLSERLGLSRQTTPEKIEQELMKLIPPAQWIWFSHAIIHHGRRICFARSPQCSVCPVRKNCPNPPAHHA